MTYCEIVTCLTCALEFVLYLYLHRVQCCSLYTQGHVIIHRTKRDLFLSQISGEL